MPRLANPIHLQKYLAGMDYPANKKDLVKHAKEKGADENVIYTLEKLPEREYNGPAGVAKEVGKLE